MGQINTDNLVVLKGKQNCGKSHVLLEILKKINEKNINLFCFNFQDSNQEYINDFQIARHDACDEYLKAMKVFFSNSKHEYILDTVIIATVGNISIGIIFGGDAYKYTRDGITVLSTLMKEYGIAKFNYVFMAIRTGIPSQADLKNQFVVADPKNRYEFKLPVIDLEDSRTPVNTLKIDEQETKLNSVFVYYLLTTIGLGRSKTNNNSNLYLV